MEKRMEKEKYDNQMRRQCFDIPVMSEGQIDRFRKNLRTSVPKNILKKIRKVVLTGCGDSYLACIASIPAFKKYAGAFAADFEAVRCIDISRFMNFEKGEEDSTLVIGVSASGSPARMVEIFRRTNAYGCHTLALTNDPYSPSAKEASYSLIMDLPPLQEADPGLKNYYASLLGLFSFAAYLGEEKELQKKGSLEELFKQTVSLTKAYEISMNDIDDQMFVLSKKWKTQVAIDVVGDFTGFATAGFIGAKYVEAVGMMASATDTENWCHVQYFKHNPTKIGTVFVANSGEKNHSRVIESIRQAVGIGRPVFLITDVSKEEFAIEGDEKNEVVVCKVPKTQEGFEFLAPLLNFIPGSILAGYVARHNQEIYFRAEDSLQYRSEVGRMIRDSEIVVI